ncbi:MAG: SDR family oxidoreductase, partial [Gillisia sp.]|nr:SDR family oxidoreductase [Gillisia sp.]
LKLKNVHSISCDITREDSLEKAVAYIRSEWKNVDILVNNAGAILNKPFLKSSVEEFKNIYNTNVFGVVGIIQKILPLMPASGHVVNISSMGGVQGSVKFAGLSAYSSSKGALITLTELLAEEYKENGPSFNVLALGAVQTEMLEKAFPGLKAPLSAIEMAEYIVDFSLNGQKYYNGKLLQVSNSTP